MSKAWFAPKRFGYGAGLPISWEGWAVLIGFFVALFAVMTIPQQFLPLEDATVVHFIGAALLVAVIVVVARKKTEGGWRWRNGSD
jgi:hypothetical protein